MLSNLKKIINNKTLTSIVLVAVLLRFIGLMPNTINADEAFTQTYSWDLVKNFVENGDINPHTFKYGTLMFYSQALFSFPIIVSAYLVEGLNTSLSSDFTAKWLEFGPFYDEAIRKYEDLLVGVGRAQTAFFGVLTVLVVYLIGKNLFNKRVGLVSAFFLAITPLHVRDSHYITTDILSVLSIMVAVLFMVHLIKSKKWKWFALSGIALGISTTIRYYPIAFLAYPIAILLSFTPTKSWLLKAFGSVIFIFVGVFIGVPFLFLEKNGFELLMVDLEKYALPWYSTSISTYVFSLITSLLSGGKESIPDVKLLYQAPSSFRFIHLNWIFFNGFGLLPTIISLLGAIVLLLKSPKKFIFLATIPLANFVYISSYIPATYERLVIPTLPFLSIFVAIFIDYLYSIFKKFWNFERAIVLVGVLVTITAALPFEESLSSSIACSQKSIQNQSAEWVDINIPLEAKIGYLTMVSTPSSKTYAAWEPLEPLYDLSLEQAKSLGLDHAFINAGRLDYNTYSFFNEFFITSSPIYENSYYSLVLSEYFSRSERLGIVRKPLLCDASRIYYYKLPVTLSEGTQSVAYFNFEELKSTDLLELKNVDESGVAKISLSEKNGRNKSNALKYDQTSFGFTPSRVTVKIINVTPEKQYTFSFWMKAVANIDGVLPQVIGRIDFYGSEQNNIIDQFEEALLLAKEGPTPIFYEKRRELDTKFGNTDLPGKLVALSIPSKLNEDWQRVVVTTGAPNDAKVVVLSIQPITTNANTILIDDVALHTN